MNTIARLPRREALKIWSLTLVGLFTNSCNGDGKDDKPPAEEEKKTAQVKQAAVVSTLDMPCMTSDAIWAGPNNAVVFVELKSGEKCYSQLSLKDNETGDYTFIGEAVKPGQEFKTSVTVPDTKRLFLSCTGPQDGGSCTATIRKVEPPLPANTSLGTAQTVQVPAPVKNPTAAPPMGTPIRLDCGKNVELWSGKASYVTVVFKGTKRCFARIDAEQDGSPVRNNTTDESFCETFGPVTKLTGHCDGSGTDTCEFQVTETIELP